MVKSSYFLGVLFSLSTWLTNKKIKWIDQNVTFGFRFFSPSHWFMQTIGTKS